MTTINAAVPPLANEPYLVAGYSQGGTIVDGVAYFTANSYQEKINPGGSMSHVYKAAGYPYVGSFDARTLKPIRTYNFADTYDSTPLVIQRKDGTWLVLAHEFADTSKKTVAMNRDTGEVVWTSAANQPGAFFFGYGFYTKKDGVKVILQNSKEGLHAMSIEDGLELWFVPGSGLNPCVDQQGGWVYYQTDGRLTKIDAETGQILTSVAVPKPTSVVAGNTVLVNDLHGYFIVTYWYSAVLYGSAIRVYDGNLNPVWEQTGLAMSKKATLTYHGGKVFAGSGDHWQTYPQTDLKWKNVRAYDVQTGKMVWETELGAYIYETIQNIIYCNGYLLAETQSNKDGWGYHIFILTAADGAILKDLYNDWPANSCAPPVFSGGRLYSGDLCRDAVLVTEIGQGEMTDWVGAYGDGQMNQMCAPDEALRSLNL